MSWDFRVGQKIVCVTDLSAHSVLRLWVVDFPAQGRVYTIKDVFEGPGAYAGDIYVRLAEVVNAPVDTRVGPFEPGFWAGYFRPLVERKTDISVFTAMLNPSKQRVDA